MEYTKCKIKECEFYTRILDDGKTQSEYCYVHYEPILTINDYRNAIDACSGCNVSGLVRVMSEVMNRLWATDRKYGVGTYFVNHHPIIQLYAYQIAYLSHGREPIEWSGFSDAYKFCQSVIDGKIEPDSNWMVSITTCYHKH